MCEKQIGSSSFSEERGRTDHDHMLPREGGMAADRDREEEDIMTICSAMAGGGSKVCCRRDDDLRYDPGRRKRKRAKSQKMKYRAQHQTG